MVVAKRLCKMRTSSDNLLRPPHPLCVARIDAERRRSGFPRRAWEPDNRENQIIVLRSHKPQRTKPVPDKSGDYLMRNCPSKLVPLAVMCVLAIGCAAALAADAPQGESLSDALSDRIVSVSQGWGELGLNTSAGGGGPTAPEAPHQGQGIRPRTGPPCQRRDRRRPGRAVQDFPDRGRRPVAGRNDSRLRGLSDLCR